MSKPRAHLFNEGGGVVTGTHDIAEARRLIIAEWLDWYANPDNRLDIADASQNFRARSATLETGRIVPNNPETGDPDYTWFWRSGYALGKAGVTKAVVWHA